MPSSHTCVIAPSPQLTITVEDGSDDEIHLHAGGQGVWIARMLHTLRIDTTLVASFGGEIGNVLRGLLRADDVEVQPVPVTASNGAYIHDRRSGDRQVLAVHPAEVLARHDRDDFYSASLAAGLDAGLCVLGGYDPSSEVIPADDYRRLVVDLKSNGTTTVADLSGDLRDAVLAGGVDVVKTSDEDLAGDGTVSEDPSDAELLELMARWADRGVEHVVVTRGTRGTLVLSRGRAVRVTAPRVEVRDHRGAGDSVTAGIAAGLARGESFLEAVRLGVAAAALNVTRRGLATGRASDIEELIGHVDVDHLPPEERGAAV
jgi:1-phosphofructokinase